MGFPYKNYAYDSKFHWVNNIAKDYGYNPVASTVSQEYTILCWVTLMSWQSTLHCLLPACGYIAHGRRNRSGRPGDRWINVCFMVPKRLADAISEVLTSKKLSTLRTDNQLLGRQLSLIAGLKHYGILCKANGPFYTMF